MKGKLIKKEQEYDLIIKDRTFATTDWRGVHKGANSATEYELSIVNCEAVERGYDLDKFADNHCNKLYHEGNINWDHYRMHFKEGFKKALEVFAENKFTKKDILKAIEFDRFVFEYGNAVASKSEETIEEFVRDLEFAQEWDVEVELSEIITDDLNGMEGNIFKLDKKGCLILKRI